MRKISDISCRENQNTHFMFNFFFFSKIVLFMRQCGKIRSNQTDHRCSYSMEQKICNWHAGQLRQECRSALIIFNTYGFSSVKMVMQTCLNINACLVSFWNETVTMESPTVFLNENIYLGDIIPLCISIYGVNYPTKQNI